MDVKTEYVVLEAGRTPPQQADVENPQPGTTWELVFPDLPPTLQRQQTGEDVLPTLFVHLPDNFNKEQEFPLLAFIPGGHGGNGEKHLAAARSITQDKDAIAVCLPLFRESYDPAKDSIPLFRGDHEILARSYEKMLSVLYDIVPNTDHERSALGGFSNGSLAVQLLVAELEPFILEHFQSFFMVDGAVSTIFGVGGKKGAISAHNFLTLVGDQPADDWRRQATLNNAEALARWADEEPKLNLQVIVMENTPHAFPKRYHPVVRDWICEVSENRLPQ